MYLKPIHLLVFSCFASYLFSQQVKQIKAENSSSPSILSIRHLNNPANSFTADLAPVRYGERIYFTSLQRDLGQGKKMSGIFSMNLDNTLRYETEINVNKKNFHVGSIALTPDARRLYFSLCNDNKPEQCEIWYRDREYEGGWSVPKKLSDEINLKGFTATQPSVGWDAHLKKNVLYFVTDRPGGIGKKDIWCSPINWDGTFEKPFSLPFNTVEDDVTPYFNQAVQTLYFSSNGLKGLGRFDIFKTSRSNKEQWNRPQNMGRPFNTAYDDVYFSCHEYSQKAYLASNRPGSVCDCSFSEENCFDLYEINFAEPLTSESLHQSNQLLILLAKKQ